MSVEVKIPSLGESVSEGVIARWVKQDGEAVSADETILELETDKAMMEIPAETSGVLKVQVQAGETVEVGQVVATIEEGEGAPAGKGGSQEKEAAKASDKAAKADDGGKAAKADRAKQRREAAAEHPPAGDQAPPSAPDAAESAAVSAPESRAPAAAGAEDGETPLSPAVRKLVAEYNLDPGEIAATGKGGRLTKGDVLDYLERQEEAEPTGGSGGAPSAPPPPTAPRSAAGEGDGEERVPMTMLRKRIAERLVQAQQNAAILTTFNEIDMQPVMDLRARYKEAFQQRHGIKLGFMGLFGKACIAAARDVPEVNAQIDGEEVVYHRHVNLGIAVGTERGLLVPIIRQADRLSLAELEQEIGTMAEKARDRKVTPDDLTGGTFTISNGGVYGSLLSTPILNPPQSGILGMHKIEKRAVVVDDEIVIRPMMYVALSYDHRLVDGEQAVTFLVRVKAYLEDPARLVLDV